ncbi:MAG: hypothetical protein IJW86_03905 [Clostridia bacterium]|nr:hypothetical protein [Clostridia bacterium]
MKVGKLKQLSKKSLSVLLAVIMIMTSMSVCFGTVSFAAGGTASDTQWNELINALKAANISGATFDTSTKGAYVLDDPDGTVLTAVEKYWSVFTTLANTNPATGNPNNTSNSTGSNESNRTINQVNDTIKSNLSSKMGSAYTAAMADFVTKLISGANVSSGTGSTQTVGGSTINNTTVPGTNLSAVSDITLTVKKSSVLTSYTLENLPDSVVTSKIFKVTHKNDRYDYTYTTGSTGGCDSQTTYTRTYAYFYYIGSATASDGSSQDTSLLTQTRDLLAGYKDYFSYDMDTLVSKGVSTLASVKTAVNDAKNNVVKKFSEGIWKHFFATEYDVETLSSNIDLATEIISVGTVCYNLYELMDAGYIGKDEAGLRQIYSDSIEGLKTFDGASQGTKEYLTSKGFVRSDVQAFADEVLVEIKLIELRRIKADIDNTIPTYYTYNEDNVISGAVSGATLAAAKGKVDGFISSINSYPANLVNIVMRGYTDTLGELSSDLAYLIKTANYNDRFSAEYAKYIAEIYSATDLTADSEDLVESLKGNADEGIEGYDAWYTGLKNLLNSIAADLEEGTADKILEENDEAMKARMEAVYTTLHARIDAQLDNVTVLYNAVKAQNGKIDIININNYTKYKQAFKSFDKDTYDYLKDEAKNFTMPQATIDKFNALSDDFTVLENFIATGGFSSFSQIFGEYENRDVLGSDLVRDEEYVVNKAKVENVIKGIDKAIATGEIKELIGGLLNEDGSPLNIGSMLKDLIADMVFSDATINMIMQMLYPLVLGELLKVWEKDLPREISDPVTATITYNKTIDVIAVEAGLPLFPGDVADSLDKTKYADNIAMLKTASKNYITHPEYKEDGSIDKIIVDQTPWTEENPNLFNEDGTLKLTWGVDAAKEEGKSTDEIAEAFYHGFDDAMHCLKPLLNVLVANTAWSSNQVKDVASISAKVLITINDNAHLTIGASACAGYANLLVPIFEALGARVEGTEGAAFTFKAPSVIEDYAVNSTDSAADMLRAIFEPVFGLLDTLGNAPLATIISILPNLCYALSMQMIPSLLNMLGTKLDIGVQLSNSMLQGCVGDMLADLLPSMDLNIAEMVGDINELIDLSDGVNSLLALLGLPLPAIEQGKIAQMGTMDKFTSARYATHYDKATVSSTTGVSLGSTDALTIAADKGAVGNYLLSYIFGIIEDEEAFRGLLSLLVTKEVPVLDENGQPTYDDEGNEVTEKVADEEKIEETLASFDEMGLFGHGTDNAIAAVVELFNQEYNDNFAEYNWYVDELFDGTIQGLTPAMVQYLSYNSDLTKEKAQYIVDHLDELIGSVLDMVNGDEEGTFSLAAKLDELIGGLFTNANITALAKALSGLDLNALLAGDETDEEAAEGENEPETVAEGDASEGGEAEEAPAIDINALIKDVLGIDLSAFAVYKDLADDTYWGFTDGDADGFVEAMVDVLAPLDPVINFLLAGGKLEAIKDESGAVITLLGYNGYDTALVPLLEALGCDVKALEAGDNALVVALKAIVAKLGTITGEGADAVEGLLGILPGLLYFIQSNALATVVDNLLHGVYVILDTIRPIIDLDLNKLIGDLTKNLELSIDLNNLDINFVLGLVKSLVGLDLTALGVLIEDVCKVAVEPYESKSSIIGKDGKKGAYTALFDSTDLVAVILNFAFEWCTDEANVDALANVIGGDDAETVAKTKQYIEGIYALIEGIEPEYGDINWAYNFPEGFDKDDVIFSSGISIQPTIESLNYPTDWTEETAKYLDENLDALIASALKIAGVEGTLSDMFKENINIFTGANLNAIVTLITDLLDKLGTEIVNNAGVLIGADLDALKAYKADEEKTYTAVEFAQELAKILGVIPEVINLVFFGEDFTLFNYSDGSNVATIKGAMGYAEGLAPILEALGCKDLPTADSKDVEGVLVSLAKRFDEIMGDPINEILDVLPNVIYFLNANGISVSVKNMLASVTGIMAQLKDSFGVDVDLIAIINDAINGLLPEESTVEIDANNLTLEAIFLLVEELLGMDLDAAAMILVDLCVGKIEPYTSLNGDYGFRMVYDDAYARYDMITILVTVALMLVENEQNAKALDELIGAEIMSGLKSVFESAPVVYATPDWDYCWAEDGIDYDNNTVDVIKYSITYPNNWTEESAKYIADNLGEIGDMIAGLIDSNYSTLGELVGDKVKIYSGENIEAIASAVADLLTDIDETLLRAAGLLLKVDVVGLKSYKAPASIDTADEFAKELANVLTTYAGGLIDWLLFGKDYRFFVDETVVGDKYEEGEEIITINGGLGYEEGLALILEALGVDLTNAKTVEDILKAAFARLDAILANPAVEVFNLLPNLLYFLNANGVAIAIDNLTAAVTTLINKLTVFGLELDIAELIDIPKLLGIEDAELSISIDNLTVEAILELVAHLTGIDLELLEDVLVGFALGEVKQYTSVSHTGVTYKMYYNDEFAVYDMITVLANIVILTAKDEDNAAKLEELLGEDIYALLLNLFNMGEVPVQEFDWKFTDKADTGYVFSAISTSELYENHQYGPLYTEEMAQYIADNIGEFIDNIIYLLGISIEGKSVDNLSELINGLVNGSLYNSENVVAIRDALAGVLSGIADLEVNGANVGKHIVAVLKSSLGVDVTAVAKVNVPEFTQDRAQFVTYLCDVLEPLYPVLKWVLADEDISFFVDLDKSDAITLPGAEGYAYGIIPLLEVLGCEGVLTQAEYYAAIEADGDVIITAFLDSLLDRVDVIMANPADEILSMLPNLIYFINSNGVDTVVKNILNAVYTLLSAIEPIAKIDLYELIGIDLSTLTFEKLFDMLLDMIAESTGYEFSTLDASAVAELTVGTLESYTSANGKKAYRMIYQSEGAEAEMVTVTMRLIVTFIMHENNQEVLLGLLRDNLGMTAEAEKYVRGVLKVIGECATETYLGMDKALATLYYIYYGLDIGVGETTNGVKDLNAEWKKAMDELKTKSPTAWELLDELLGSDTFEDVLDTEEGIAPNGFIAFFQKIAAFFQRIADWFKNLFN